MYCMCWALLVYTKRLIVDPENELKHMGRALVAAISSTLII